MSQPCKTCIHNTKESNPDITPCNDCGEGYMYYEPVAKIIDIEKNQPHKVSEVICINCYHRWLAVRPSDVKLKDLECKCGLKGYVIETGEVIN